MSYAIDFGTSNTVIARWNAASQQPETIGLAGLSERLGSNPALVPSLVYVEDAAAPKVWVGQQVRDRGLDVSTDARFFRGFKRGIGTKVQGFLPELDGRQISFEQVGRWFLEQLLVQLRQTDPEAGQALVLTVPVDSFEAYRHWLSQVCHSLPLQQVRLLDEPTAAALGYAMTDQELLLVIDFGGGTLDLSVVQLELGRQGKPLGFVLKWGEKFLADNQRQLTRTARVLAKAGQNLGGSDLDHWLADYFQQTQNLAVSALTLRLAERLKIQLSQQTQATEIYFNENSFETLELQLSREQFNQILREREFFARLDAAMTQVLQQVRRAGVTSEQIGGVLLVGGTTQIPAVQDWLTQYFPVAKIRSQRPFEAIAQGALQLSQGLELKDFLYHSYGIRYWDHRQNAHNWHPLIAAGQAYPMDQPVELVLGASTPGQPSIELIIGELGSSTGGTEVYFDGDRLITRTLGASQTQVQALNDREGARSIAQLTPPGNPGGDRIRVLFQVDGNRSLRMTVEDLLTEERLLTDQVVAQLS